MFRLIKSFVKEDDGMGTVEIVIIIAVLVGIALIFRAVIIEFVSSMLKSIFGEKDQFAPSKDTSSVIDDITGTK